MNRDMILHLIFQVHWSCLITLEKAANTLLEILDNWANCCPKRSSWWSVHRNASERAKNFAHGFRISNSTFPAKAWQKHHFCSFFYYLTDVCVMPLAGLRCFSSHCRHSLAPTTAWPSSSHANTIKTRHASWKALLKLKPKPPSPEETTGNEEEEAAKAAILEKVMKGRLPTDLMLRCASPWHYSSETDY